MLPVIVGVSHDDLFLNTKTESMWRVELAFTWTELSKLASGKIQKMKCNPMLDVVSHLICMELRLL